MGMYGYLACRCDLGNAPPEMTCLKKPENTALARHGDLRRVNNGSYHSAGARGLGRSLPGPGPRSWSEGRGGNDLGAAAATAVIRAKQNSYALPKSFRIDPQS